MKILPCIQCGSNDIEINDCGYTTFNVAWGKCIDCDNTVKLSPVGWDISKERIVLEWNMENDPNVLRARYESQIKELQKKIDNLPKI